MGVLNREERAQLRSLLLRVPSIEEAPRRRALLSDLPSGLRNAISIGNDPFSDVFSIVDTVDGDGAQLPDGTWPIAWIIKNAIVMTEGLRLQSNLEELLESVEAVLESVQERAIPIVLPPREGDRRVTLEQYVNPAAAFGNIETWIARMGEVARAVCRVEVPGQRGSGYGTGVLVGPSTVLTNHHVVDGVIRNRTLSPFVVLRFDYRTDATGRAPLKPKVHVLADDWLVDSSPAGELDYAVLRTTGRPGDDAVGGRRRVPRGWLKPYPRAFASGQPLFVVQHPEKRPLQVAVDVVLDVTDEGRVRYRTNTAEGSSGAPCFNDQWELVALHHGGVAAADGAQASNQGIAMSAILAQPIVQGALGG